MQNAMVKILCGHELLF